jgi:hypothetical protein
MDAARLFVFIRWVFAACRRFIVGDASFVVAPMEIPDHAVKISNDVLHQMYGHHGMSENISLFIHNGDIYVYYESLDGVSIWQSVQIPYGWNVREDFQFMRYSWYNRDDDGIPQNLQILVFFDGGFLKLTFSSKWAHHEVEGDNFVHLVDITVFPYSSISDECHGQQRMHQYAYDDSMLFVSASQCNGKFVLTFEQIYFDERFEHGVCKVVLPLSENVVVEYLKDLLQPQSLFFDHNGNPTEPNFVCCLEVTISGERFLMELRLDPQSVQQYFADDGTDGLGVYSRMTSQNFRNFDCIKRSRSDLVGLLNFYDSDELDAAKLLEIFPVNEMCSDAARLLEIFPVNEMCSDAAKILSSFARMNLYRDRALKLRLEQTRRLTDCRICMEQEPNLFIFSCGHASFCQSCIDGMTRDGITICPVCRLPSTSLTNGKDFLPLCRKFFPEE